MEAVKQRRGLESLFRWRWLLLMAAAPFLLFPTPSTALVLLIVPGLGFLAWCARRDPIPRTPLNLPILLLSFMMFVSLGATYDVAISLPKIAGLLLGISIFYCFVSYGANLRGFQICLVLFLLAGLGIAFVGLLGTHWSIKFDVLIPFTYRFEPRVTGLPGAEQGISPNEVAGALLWVIPFFLSLSVFGLIQWRQLAATTRRWFVPGTVLIWEMTLFVVFVFVLCQSRSAYLALAVSVFALLFVLISRRWQWLVGSLLVMGIMLSVFIGAGGPDPSWREIFNNPNTGGRALSIDTLGGRVEIWSRALLGVEKYPLTGMGMNTFRYQMNTLAPRDPIYVDRDIAHAHNEFLQVALDLGIPGLCAFLAIYHMAFWMLNQVWHIATKEMGEFSGPYNDLWNPRLQRYLVVGLGGGLFAHLLYSFTDVVALGAKPGILFWMLLGLVVSLYSNCITESASPT